MFRPIKTKKNSEEIIEQIKKLIVDGKLNAGDKLPSERELAERLDVSRTSVREAFSALEIMGIIKIHPGEGSFVNQVSYEGMFQQMSFLIRMDAEENMLYLFEVRKILETENAGLAAIRATRNDLELIEKSLVDMDEEVKTGGIGNEGDLEFHLAVAKAANNPLLLLLMNTVSDILGSELKVAREKLFLIENMPVILNDSHKKIYNAILAKDEYSAKKRMREHLVLVEKALLLIKGGKINKSFFSELGLPNADLGFPS